MNISKSCKNFLLVLLTILVIVVLSEVGLRILCDSNLFADERTDDYWIDRIISTPRKADSINERDTVYDSILGWRMRPLFASNGINHNSLGYRGSREYSESEGAQRILAIGDSFTYGLGVRDEETFSSHLGCIMGVESVNAGVNAYGVDQAILMWEREGHRLKPNVVVLGYYVDDFYRNILAVRDHWKPRFKLNSTNQQFELQTAEQSEHYVRNLRKFPNRLATSRLYQAGSWLWRKTRLRLGFVADMEMLQGAQLSQYLLGRLKESVARSDAKLIVAVIGDRYGEREDHLWIEGVVMQSCQSLKIECVNLAAAMRAVDSTSFYGPNYHYSASGHRFAAEQIAQALGATPLNSALTRIYSRGLMANGPTDTCGATKDVSKESTVLKSRSGAADRTVPPQSK